MKFESTAPGEWGGVEVDSVEEGVGALSPGSEGSLSVMGGHVSNPGH